jgi:hypothetical protein
MATMTVLLDTLPTPSTDGLGEVYQRLKSILGTTSRRDRPPARLPELTLGVEECPGWAAGPGRPGC